MTVLEDTPAEPRLVFPALGRLYSRFSPYHYTIMRLFLGLILTPHGFSELFGGLMVALGLFTRLGALAIIIEMTVVTFVIQRPYGYYWTQRGFEFPLLIWLQCIAVFFRGGGRYSIDRVIIGKEL